MVSAGHLVQRIENPESPLVQVFLDVLASRAARQVLFRAVFAREKPGAQGKVGDDAQSLFPAEGFELRFILGTIVQVV